MQRLLTPDCKCDWARVSAGSSRTVGLEASGAETREPTVTQRGRESQAEVPCEVEPWWSSSVTPKLPGLKGWLLLTVIYKQKLV